MHGMRTTNPASNMVTNGQASKTTNGQSSSSCASLLLIEQAEQLKSMVLAMREQRDKDNEKIRILGDRNEALFDQFDKLKTSYRAESQHLEDLIWQHLPLFDETLIV